VLELDIPGYGTLALEHLVLDVNGTIAGGGQLLPGVAEGLAALNGVLHPVAITADTQGTAAVLGERLGIEVHVISSGWEAPVRKVKLESAESSMKGKRATQVT